MPSVKKSQLDVKNHFVAFSIGIIMFCTLRKRAESEMGEF